MNGGGPWQFLARLAVIMAAAALAALAFGAAPSAHEHHDLAAVPTDPTAASLYNLDSTWTNQDGASAPLKSLVGRPVVAAMGYTSCKDICPATVANMMWIEKHLPADAAGHVKFAFFSIDSAGDTPEKLKAYADEHGFDPTRWALFHGDEDAVRELAAALGVGYRPDGQGGFDHAVVISLIDAKGEIVFQQRGTQAASDELLDKLKGLLTSGG
jgi:protein SCO1/2